MYIHTLIGCSSRISRFVLCVLVLFALVFTNGCSSSPPERRGIKLSEASAEASKQPEEQKPLAPKKAKGEQTVVVIVEDEEDYDDPDFALGVAEVVEAEDEEAPFEPAPGGPNKVRPTFGLALGGGSLRGDQIDGFGIFSVVVGADFYEERFRVSAGGLYLTTNRTEDNKLSSGLVDEFELALDLSGRFFFTPSHTFMGLYAVLGLRIGYLFWDYKNPIVVNQLVTTETIKSDRIGYGAPFVGIGVNLAQIDPIQIGANLTAGYKAYSSVTREGFDNDIFDDEPMIQLIFDFTVLSKPTNI